MHTCLFQLFELEEKNVIKNTWYYVKIFFFLITSKNIFFKFFEGCLVVINSIL